MIAVNQQHCARCGKHFDRRADALYCSKICRQRAFRQRRREELERLRAQQTR